MLDWKRTIDAYAGADPRRSTWQVASTLVLLVAGYVVMWWSLRVGYWLTLVLALPTAGLQVRAFVLFHDATHGSLFASKKMNDAVGIVLGLACYTPYFQWRRRHALHHATTGDLDRRGWWEVPTATVAEYAAMTSRERAGYRVMRSPWMLFTVGSFAFFLVVQRFGAPGQRSRERVGVWATNAALAGMVAIAVALVGWQATLAVALPVALVAASAGLWLFYVQHQFDDAYWRTHDEWSFYDAAMKGASFYRLPALLRWFSASIGFHHVHHLNPRVPNYRLRAAHEENPQFQDCHTLALGTSLACVRANLWDGTRMVSFREARAGGT